MSNIKVEMLTVNDFNHICRTCSSDGELKSLFDNIETLSMLESFTQMQFSKTDELPDKICQNCLTKINDCFHFINNCKIVDEGFRKCLNQPEVKTEELHTIIDIKEEAEPPESLEPVKEELVDEPPKSETNEKTKEIGVKQSEYYILKWGSPSENQENKHFQVTVVNNPSNEQGLLEQEALRRLQAMNRMRKYRARHHNTTSDETRLQEKNRVIPVFSTTNDTASQQQQTDIMEDAALRRANDTNETALQRTNLLEDSHRARAKLTLPHSEHNATMRRNYETPERIALRRAIAREQMRKYRSKLTAEETAEHRALVSENMRKLRAKFHNQDVDKQRSQACEYIRRYRSVNTDDSIQNQKQQQIPLRLSEMARTLLQPLKDPLDTSPPSDDSRETSRFSLRPTRIPQVKKQFYETHCHSDDKLTKFRSWKRHESTDEVTIRLAKNALQMKRFHSVAKDPAPLEESALRRAKAAGQLRQYRPMLRKSNVPHVQTGK